MTSLREPLPGPHAPGPALQVGGMRRVSASLIPTSDLWRRDVDSCLRDRKAKRIRERGGRVSELACVLACSAPHAPVLPGLCAACKAGAEAPSTHGRAEPT